MKFTVPSDTHLDLWEAALQRLAAGLLAPAQTGVPVPPDGLAGQVFGKRGHLTTATSFCRTGVRTARAAKCLRVRAGGIQATTGEHCRRG